MNELIQELKQQYQNYDQDGLNKAFIEACTKGHLDIIKYLLTAPNLKEHAYIHATNDLGFRKSCEYGHLDVVKYLLTSPDLTDHAHIHALKDYGFQWACAHGHLDVVRYLLTSPELTDHADIHVRNDHGFQWACYNQDFDMIHYFLSFKNEQYINFQKTPYNIDWAIKHQYDDVIQSMFINLMHHDFNQYLTILPSIHAYKSHLVDSVTEKYPEETNLLV